MLLCIAAAVPFLGGIGMLFQQLEQDGVRWSEAAWVGTHSLTYYLFHMFYAWLISIIFGFSALKMEWWVALLVAIVSIALCTGQCFLVDLIVRIIAKKRAKKAPVVAKIGAEERQKEEGMDRE
jgi:peptidoglycan/LPS O-acetylase OafA/YrhL